MSQTRDGAGALVIFPGALGDLVCFTPALAALRARHAGRVMVVCAAVLGGLARLLGAADVCPIEGREASWLFADDPPREAGEFFGGFDAVECFTGFGVDEVARNLERWGGRLHRFRPPERIHFAAHCLRAVGASAPPPEELGLDLDPGAPITEPPLNRAPCLFVHPGSGGLAKRWSKGGFRELLGRWRRATGGDVVVVLGPAEAAEVDEWRSEGAVTIVPEDVVSLARVLRRADVYLGNDSGASHLAAAVGRRGLALFGPSDEVRWAPLGERLRALRVEPWTEHDRDPPRATILQIERALTEILRSSSP